MSTGLTALVLGSTGETGKALVQELLKNAAFSKIILLTRRKSDVEDEKIQNEIVDFEKLEDHKAAFDGAQVGYCCLGTTRAKAGAKGFVRVDRDYVVNSAKLLIEAGCSQFHLVSSMGASAGSFFLYTKTKGETENLIKDLGFPRFSIYQPGLLVCDRTESRFGERISRAIIPSLDFGNSMSVRTDILARAMIAKTLESPTPGKNEEKKVEVLKNQEIYKLGKE